LAHAHLEEHGHSHGLVDPSIKRSREGLRAVGVSLAVLGLTATAQAVVFALSGSVALLADLIHNAGDALTAVPLAIAFIMRSRRAEGLAGLAVVAAIFIATHRVLGHAQTRRYATGPAEEAAPEDARDPVPHLGYDEQSQLGSTAQLSDEEQAAHANMERSPGQR
jgi:hypothetical protein